MKIVFLAVDAGDAHLIEEWSEEGRLPSIRSLFSRSLVGRVAGLDGFYEGSTWPSFYTGVNPARHGFHRLTQLLPGTYTFHRCHPDEFIAHRPFWVPVSEAGKRVAIFDIPLSGISRGLNGIQTVEWGSHDAVHGFGTWPPELNGDITRRFGVHPGGQCCDAPNRSAIEFRDFKDRLIRGIERKTELTLHYLAEDAWDLFTQVFTEAHCVGHQCWHLHDVAHPNYDSKAVSLTGDPLREVYEALDRAIGKILAQLDRETVLIFLASHRMSHNTSKDFLLPDILERLGVLRRKPPSSIREPLGTNQRLRLAVHRSWNSLPHPVRTRLKPFLLPMFRPLQRSVRGLLGETEPAQLPPWIDLSSSRCFPHGNGNPSGIRIHLSGREPAGLVKRDEFDAFCHQLTGDLLEILDEATGKPLVARVLRTLDLFDGERIDHLPDLLVEWNEEVRVGSRSVSDDDSCGLRITSGKIGRLGGQYTYCRTGDHRPQGAFAVTAPGIEPGTLKDPVSIMDFAPTILTLFGLPCDDLDGNPIGGITRA